MEQDSVYLERNKGRKLFLRTWRPDNTETKLKGVILIAHGYAEHSERYNYTADFFTNKNFAVYVPDHYGHGRSEGVKADVPDFRIFVEDLLSVLSKIQDLEKDIPIFLLGHSMGGAISTLLASGAGNNLKGLILSGAAIRIDGGVSNFVKSISKVIAFIFPLLPLVDFAIEGLSKDPEVIEAYKNDLFNYNGKVRARMGREMLRSEELITEELLSMISIPTLILHGKKDPLVNPECSQIIYSNISSSDKEIKILDNLYHEILNEPEKDEVLNIIGKWIDARN
ncbi:MAG: lysophospholipase [Spirochaetia bacterium]|jgi:alpha-beta hydrolase superfamily lysophospholipase|nr:lysophospholipase [Spirochaetia bacterium]